MRWILIAVVLCSALTGCQAVGRWMAPIQPGELDTAAQAMLADKDTEFDAAMEAAKKKLAAMQEKLDDARATGSGWRWAFGSLSVVGMLIMACGVFVIAKTLYSGVGDIGTGAASTTCGLVLAVVSGTLWVYGRQLFLWCAIAVGIIVIGLIVLAVWRALANKDRALGGLIEGVQRAKDAVLPKVPAAAVSAPAVVREQFNAILADTLGKLNVKALVDKARASI